MLPVSLSDRPLAFFCHRAISETKMRLHAEVTLKYRDNKLIIGVVISLLTTLALIGIFARDGRRWVRETRARYCEMPWM